MNSEFELCTCTEKLFIVAQHLRTTLKQYSDTPWYASTRYSAEYRVLEYQFVYIVVFFVGAHSSAEQRFSKRQDLLTQSQSTSKQKDNFSEDLCLALISADIPFFKLKNSVLNEFLSKYTNRNILDESTLRKNYLDLCYQNTLQKLKEHISDNYVYLVVDETTDVRGNYVANLLIGKLSSHEAGYPFLLASKILDKTNHDTICRFINSSLKIFPNDSGIENRVLLLLTDAASYMIKAGKLLKTFYKNLIHVTCIAHALNLIAEKVRDSFPELNSLINQGKKSF